MPKKYAPEHEWPDVAGEKCPECGIDLEGIDPKAHADDHWPGYLVSKNLLSKEAEERREELLALAKTREE